MDYLTAEVIARRLGVNARTVKRWLQSGALVGYRLGDRAGWRVSEEELRRFLEARRGPRANGENRDDH